jgi:beta-glucosidase
MGNGTTMDRTRNDSRVSVQDLESYYLQPFRAALVDGASGSFMCAYSEINGQPMCSNQYIMSRIVRGKPAEGGWGFTGFVSSDWYAKKRAFLKVLILGVASRSANVCAECW